MCIRACSVPILLVLTFRDWYIYMYISAIKYNGKIIMVDAVHTPTVGGVDLPFTIADTIFACITQDKILH